MNIEQEIKQLIKESLDKLGLSLDGIELEHPTDMSHGDYATNVAMRLAAGAGKNPRELAEEIVAALPDNQYVTDVSVAGPGFINITLSPEYFASVVTQVDDTYGQIKTRQGQKILVEHSSPNLFKSFHVGHVMNNAIGESIVRLAKWSGGQVTAISYPSDVSLGIGKAVWALLQHGIEQVDAHETLLEKLNFLGQCYIEGTQAYDDQPEVQAEIRKITQSLYDQEPGPAWDAYQLGRRLNLEYFETITKRLGSDFDGYIFESEAGEVGKRLVLDHVGDVFTESNGAVIYQGEQDGLHTRVFINNEGNPTYEAKDVGLLKLKFDTYNPDQSIFVTDHEQGPYFEVVVTAAGKIQSEWQEKTQHLTHGRLQFKGQKISSRLGGVPLAVDILDAVADEVRERTEGRGIEEKTIDQIAIGALKFAILRVQPGKNINFDPDTSLSFEGDSGPYLQYTRARCLSVLAKYQDEPAMTVPENWETTPVERLLARFPQVVEKAMEEYSPHHVASYLIEIARAFNSWYGTTKILADDTATSYRVAITQSVAKTLQNGLWLLGIDSPEMM